MNCFLGGGTVMNVVVLSGACTVSRYFVKNLFLRFWSTMIFDMDFDSLKVDIPEKRLEI